MPIKLDSNLSGLRFTEEVFGSPGTLGGSEVWRVLEPNSYSDTGGNITTVARTPIKPGRQREKGVVTDIDAAVGFEMDLTKDNMYILMQGFMFADWRASAQVAITTVDDVNDEFEAASGLNAVPVNGLVFASGFPAAANNGLHVVSSSAAAALGVTSTLVADTPGANSIVKYVGYEATTGDLNVDASGSRPALTSTSLNFTTLPLIPGQWVYVGGDLAANKFATANNNGFARIYSIAANRLEFDKTQNTMANETGTGLDVRIFFGDLIKNETTENLIKARSYQFERDLVTAGYEYIKGAFASELGINVSAADKVTVSLGFMALDVDPTASRRAGTFPAISTDDAAYNTSTDFSRIRIATQAALQTPLFAYLTDLSLTINNNLSRANAIGYLGAVDMTAGDFAVEGNMTAYFTDVASIAAIRANTSISLDFILAKENAGWVFDVPHLTLGEGRLNVEKDTPITLPVSYGGARDTTLDTTFIACYFPYLPTAAEG